MKEKNTPNLTYVNMTIEKIEQTLNEFKKVTTIKDKYERFNYTQMLILKLEHDIKHLFFISN
jgi:dihydrodipicolinate synthase/N-acetylneuraminate lyase